MEALAYPKGLERKGRRFGSSGCIYPNKRNDVPSCILPVGIIYYNDRLSEIDEACSSWLTPIIHYLSSRELSDNRIKAHKIQVQAARFFFVNRQLYKQSLDGSYLKCLTTQQGQYILAELHEGICGNHPSCKTLAHRAHTQGCYWLTKSEDAAAYVKKCDRCQRRAPISRCRLKI